MAESAAVLLLVSACTPALPALSGSRTTPEERVDVAAGGAARVPLGNLGSPERAVDDTTERAIDLQGFTRRGGLAPLASISVPLAERTDLGVRVVSGALALALRHGIALQEKIQLLGALRPYGGAVFIDDGQGGQSAVGPRLGVDTVWVLAIDVSGVFEAWAGARAGVEHARCRLEGQDRFRAALRGTLLRLGSLVGLGVGFRRLHLLMELGADREWWWMGGDIEPEERTGFSLTPALALRLRF